MATKLGIVIADFTTSLATAMAVGATTASLQSATDDDGVALPAGRYFFSIDGGNSSKEHISCTLSGTSLTNIKSVSRQGVETSGCLRLHRVGAAVALTDFAHLKFINDLAAGTSTFDATAPLGYDGTASITTNNQFATKAYADGLAIAGAPDASTTVKGIAKASVAPVSPTSPIFVGDNDTRVPTATGAQFLLGVTGMVLPYAGSSAPTGFLLCDGSAVSRTTYAALFAIVSTTYGAGDGSTTFNLPDLRSRSIIGAGTGSKVATFASRASNVITVTGLTNAANNEFQTGQAVTYHSASSVMTGLSNDTVYYIIRTGNLTFSLATTLANAQNGTAISLSSDGSGVQTFTLALTARTRGDTGGEENHAMSSTELLAHTHDSGWIYGGSNSSSFNNVTRTGSQNNGTNVNTGSAGGNASMNTMTPFIALNYIIKT